MMGDIFVLDENLKTIGIADTYKSCIWVNRYKALGDCELYIEATQQNMDLYKEGYYLARNDDEMVCRIKKIELETDVEKGDFLIVKGSDAKGFLDQRIIWDTVNCEGNVEDFIRSIVTSSCISPTINARKFLKPNKNQLIYLGSNSGLDESLTEQISYKNLGEKIREYCERYNWGYKFTLDNERFLFKIYKGTNRTGTVIFSDHYENLTTSKYVNDATNLGNVALVAGEGEGSERSKSTANYAESIDRYEIYVDAKDLSKTITWEELTTTYPTTSQGGQGFITTESGNYVYKMNYINIQIFDLNQLNSLKSSYPGGSIVNIDNTSYYKITNAVIADLPNSAPENNDNVVLREVVYSVYLLNRGYEKLSEYGVVTSFEGTIEPNVTFTYKTDYFLGDLVAVENNYGQSISARIVEVTEVNDDKGYSVEPKFEYSDNILETVGSALSTEDIVLLTTEDDMFLNTEKTAFTD